MGFHMSTSPAGSVTATLRNGWLRALARDWEQTNRTLLRHALVPPVFRLLDGSARLGHWNRVTRELAISEEHIWSAPWREVVQTLLHEMAHQFAHEVLGATDETAHGPAFVEACSRLQIAHTASGELHVGAPDRQLERIRKLLALAESSNPNEAQIAMARANSLLLRYNIDASDGRVGARAFISRRIGTSAAAISAEKKFVSGILSRFFFVQCIWVSTYDARRDRFLRELEIMGSPENVEMGHYVHDFLHNEVERWWKTERARLGRLGRTARREFAIGVLSAFYDKLGMERTSDEERGLVWVGDPELDSEWNRRFPRTTSMAHGAGVRPTEAHSRGRSVGSKLVIRRGVQGEAASGATRLLGPRPKT